MKAVRIIISILLIPFLFITLLATTMLGSIQYLADEDTIQAMLTDIHAVDSVVDEVYAKLPETYVTVSKEDVKTALKEVGVEEKLNEYASSAIVYILYDKPFPKLTVEDLTDLLRENRSAAEEAIGYPIPDKEYNELIHMVEQNGQQIIDTVEEQIPSSDELRQTAGIDDSLWQSVQLVLDPGTKIRLYLLAFLISLGLVTLLWKSKLGFLWVGVVCLLAGAFVTFAVPFTLNLIMPESIPHAMVLSDIILQSNRIPGLMFLGVGVVMIVLTFILRSVYKETGNHVH